MDKEYGTKVNDKIFLNGYSSSGYFAQRFSLIHPELIDTACIGGSSGSIPIPNTDLDDYPSFSIHGRGISVILNEW